MSTELAESEDFDLECMCGLIETEEKERISAMSKIAKAYRAPLFVFVRHKFASFSEEDAEDVVQDVFFALWKKVEQGKFDGDGSLKSLLFTIAYRKGADELRKRTSAKRTDDEMAEQIAKEIEGTTVANAWKQAAKNKEQASEIMSHFRDFVSRLSGQQKLVAEALYAHFPDMDNNADLVQYIRERTGKVVTVMMVKGAKQALIAKFRELLNQKGLLV